VALFPCPECGNQVSTRAEACPKCGYPLDGVEVAAAARPRGTLPITPDKASWVAAIKSIPRDEQKDRLDLKSPHFTVAGWCICAEHQRSFQSVVMKWANPDHPPTCSQRPKEAEECPPGDRKKGWLFRVKLAPDQLAAFVARLR
jgi:hypothetical protein